MSLNQQIVRDKTEAIAAQLSIDEDAAFLRYAHSLVTGDSALNVDDSDLVDGGQDKQIDAITLSEKDDSLEVYVTQAKNAPSFSSNALIQLGNGLRWLFESSRTELNQLCNHTLRDRILEYRSLLSALGPSNIEIVVRFCSLGETKMLSDEFRQELERIRASYDAGTFERFSIEPWGADEIVSEARFYERRARRVDAEIKIRYDANTPSMIRYHSSDLKGLICFASVGSGKS